MGITRIFSNGAVDSTFRTGTGVSKNSGFAPGQVRDIVIQPDGKILIAGDFDRYNGVQRNGLARLNPDGALDNTFVSGSLGGAAISTMAIDPFGKILIGGPFARVDGVSRPGIARLNQDGTLDTGFDPGTAFANQPDLQINKILVQENGNLFVGGFFSSYRGNPRSCLAHILANGELDDNFRVTSEGTPAFLGNVYDMVELGGGQLLVGGQFTFFNPLVSGVVRLNANGARDTSFLPNGGGTNFNFPVMSIVAFPANRYLLAGAFTTFNGFSTGGVVRINFIGALDNSFTTSQVSSVVSCVVQPDGRYVLNGRFTVFNSIPRIEVVRLNSDGSLDSTLPNLNIGESGGAIRRVGVRSDGRVVAAGFFDRINGQTRNGLAQLNADGSLDTGFQTNVEVGSVQAIVPMNTSTYIAGSFSTVNGALQPGLARLDSGGNLDSSFSVGTGPDGSVQDLLVLPNSNLIIVGSFTGYNGNTCSRIARLNSSGGFDSTFLPGSGANNPIDRVVRQPDGKLIIIGTFTTYGGTSRRFVARLNPDGSLDPSFNVENLPSAPSSVVVQSDGKIILGGNFSVPGFPNRTGIMRVNPDGSPDIPYNTNGSGASNVARLALQADGKLLVSGTFASINGTTRPTLARLNQDGLVDLSFNPGKGFISLDGGLGMSDLQVVQDTIFVAGSFNIYKSRLRSGLARIPVKPNKTTPGAFRPSNGFVFLRNTLDAGFADVEFFYGTANDIPVVGDWDGDGVKTVGIYRNGSFYLRNSNTSGFADLQFPFGAPGDFPIVGDWDGDGIDTIGVVRGNTVFLRNSNTAGNAEIQFSYGTATDIFITGDWNGDGIDTIGAFRPTNGFVYLRNSNTTGFADLEFFYGQAGDKPVVGDWNGDGIDTIGIVRNGQWFLRNTNTSGFAEIQFFYGLASDTPITGDWDGLP